MDFGSLRTLARDLNFTVHGMPVTVQRPMPEDTTEIETRGIWITPLSDLVPNDLELQRRERRRVMALRRDEVPTVPRGTTIIAPEVMGGPLRGWRVDGIERLAQDHTRVIVLPDETLNDALGVEP